MVNPIIAAMLAKPITHNVVTNFADGTSRSFGVRSVEQARNYSVGESRKIGKTLINRESGMEIKVVSVEIVEV